MKKKVFKKDSLNLFSGSYVRAICQRCSAGVCIYYNDKLMCIRCGELYAVE